jgi:exodeoxyribonuclease VII large subunit
LPNFLAARRGAYERLAASLIHPREILSRRGADLTLLLHRLAVSWPHLLRQAQKTLDGSALRLTHPAERLAARRNGVILLAQRLEAPLPGRLREASLRLENLAARLDSVSYEKVLARGFALVTNAKGAAISSASSIAPGATLKIRFADGEVGVTAAPVQGSLGL